MKAHLLVAISTCVLPYSAYCITGRDNWQTISSSSEVIVLHPVFAGIFGARGLFNACSTEKEFKSKTPVKACVAYHQVIKTSDKGPYKDYICDEYETRNVIISRSFIKQVCVKNGPSGECVESTEVRSDYPNAFHLVVLDANEVPSNNLLFTKAYTIATCDL